MVGKFDKIKNNLIERIEKHVVEGEKPMDLIEGYLYDRVVYILDIYNRIVNIEHAERINKEYDE